MENIVVKPIETKEAEQATILADRALVEAKNTAIVSQDTYECAAELLKTIKLKGKDLEAKRKEITKPLDVAKKAVMDLFRKPLIMLVDAERIVKKGMVGYITEQERIRKEKEERLRKQAEAEERRKKKLLEDRAKKAEAEGNAEKAEELRDKKEEVSVEAPVLADTTETPKGVSYKERWTAEVIDFKLLPDEYKLSNMSMLNKVAQATKGEVPVAGVKFNSEKEVASRLF